MENIESIEHLIELINRGFTKYFINLGTTRKNIQIIPLDTDIIKSIAIINSLGTYEEILTIDNLEETALYTYILEGSLFKY